MRAALQRLDGRVGLVQASQLKPAMSRLDDSLPGANGDERPRLTVLAWERYPLRARDDVITGFIGELNVWFACELRFHAALDTPPMSMFAGETTRAILQRLGMKATDSIQHPMLSKSLAKAQAKVAEKDPVDPKPGAQSAVEWFDAWKLDRLT